MIRIEQFDISGYEHLRAIYAFGPGLNVVTGPNESGKSTLHEALTVGLFGFKCEERRRSGGRSAKDLRRPWTGPPFGGVLTVVDRHERLVRVRWDFDADLVEVTDAATGQVVLSEQPQQRREYTVGPQLLGLSREDHRQLSCLFQEGLDPVQPSQTLRQSLQRAAELTAGTDGGVDGAEQRLKMLLSDLGVHAGHYGSIPSGRLARTEADVRALETRLDQAAKDRLGLEELTWRRVQLETQLAEVGERIVDQQQATLRANAERFAKDHGRALQLAQSTPDNGCEPPPALAPDLDGRVAAAREDVVDAECQLAEATNAAASSAGELTDAREAARRAESERARLVAYADVDTSNEEAVRTELGRLRSATPSVAPPPAPSPRDPRVERFRPERARLEAQASASSGKPAAAPSAPLLTLAAVLAVAGVGGGVIVHPGISVLVVVAAVVAVVALRKRAAAAPTAPLLFEGRPIAELARAADEEDRAWLRHEAAIAEHERVVADSAVTREAAEAALRRLLDADDASPAPLETRADDYLRQCTEHREYAAAQQVAEGAATRARNAAAPAEEVRRVEQAWRDAETELRRLLGRAGIEEDDLDIALEAFDTLVAAETSRREEAERRADAAGRLEQLLGGQSLDDLAAAAAQAARDLEAHVAAHGVRTGRRTDGPATGDEIAARERLIEDLADLRARIEEREAGMDDPADLELRLDEARTELARLVLYRDAARVAREELVEAAMAAHRKVAPHLNAALARTLPHITRGRYHEAMVDDDLSIRVVALGPVTLSTSSGSPAELGTRSP